MTTVKKSYPVAMFKALTDEAEGTFEAIVSTIGNVDLQGDRVVSGAYDKSIESWQKSGNPMPVLWSHDWSDPFAHIGFVDPKNMREVKAQGSIPAGLYVKGHLDIDKPFAKQVFDLLSERRVTEWSFSYDIPPGGEKRAKDGANELLEVGLIEIGPTLKGASSITTTIGTKNDPDETRTMARLTRAVAEQWEYDLKAINDEIAKAAWNGDAAMQSCKNAADFRQIAFERANDSDPDTAAHWALPHHSSPGADANPAGVSAALGALNGARGGAPDLKSASAARSHLEAHQASESKAAGDPSALIDWFNNGADGAINWGAAGDWDQCVTEASKHMSEADAQGFCQLRHMDATGMTTSEHAHQEGKAAKFSDDQPRDDSGRWTSGGGGDSSSTGGGSSNGGRVSAAEAAQAVPTPSSQIKEGDRIIGHGERMAVVTNVAHTTVQGDQPVTHIDFRYEETAHPGARSESDSMMNADDVTVRVLPKKSFTPNGAKAGRVLGTSAIQALKQAISDAIDEFADDMNGVNDADAGQEDAEAGKAQTMGDAKAFAIGYGDGSAGREKASDGEEYSRGYAEGVKDRGAVEDAEISTFNALFDELRIR